MAISEEHMVRIILCTVGIELTYLKGINSKKWWTICGSQWIMPKLSGRHSCWLDMD